MRRLSCSPFVCLFLFVTQSLSADIIHVPGDSTTIQGGINGAVDGDTVMVHPGSYYEHDIDFQGKAITVMGTDPEDSAVVAATVVDGGSLGTVFYFQSGEDSTSILAGMTITGGDGFSFLAGGINCDFYSSPVIANNIITGNEGDHNGGGIAAFSTSSPIITGNIITGNSASWGGGIYCQGPSPVITENVITNNSGYKGGGISCLGIDSTLIISNNIIVDNQASSWGGGIYCGGALRVEIEDNIMKGNQGGNGGAVYCEVVDLILTGNEITENFAYMGSGGGIGVDNSTSMISDNIITGNRTESGHGGGIYCGGSDMRISNNIISENSVTDPIAHNAYGGGVFSDDGILQLKNNIISGNSARIAGGVYARGLYAGMANNTITENRAIVHGGGILTYSSSFIWNTVFWDNDAPIGREIYMGGNSYQIISYSDVKWGQGLAYVEKGTTLIWGEGMVDADPLLVTFRGFDYLLKRGSPCIDTGDPAIYDGFEWPAGYDNGSRSDMGAYGGPGNVGWLPE